MQSSPTTTIRASRLISATPVYYGWVILVAGTIGMILTAPGQTYAISVFIDYFIEELNISRGLVSTLYTAGTLTASLALPFVGRLIDQRGSRFMMIVIAFLFGLACFYMQFVRNAIMLAVGFWLLRMLGQGSLSLVSRNVINQWWVRRRGIVMGIAGMAMALLSSGSFPGLINWLIPQFGWRTTYIILGLMIWIIVLPLGLIFVRNRPEEYGLPPDGIPIEGGTGSGAGEPLIEENWTRAEALQTSTFWLISAGFLTMSAISTGLVFHIFDIFRDSGLNSAVTAFVFVPMSATAAIVQLVGGYLVDRLPIRALLTTALCLQAVTLIMAPFLTTVQLAYTFGLLTGVRGGLQMIVGSVIWAKYFGRAHLGAIAGLAATLNVAGSALGPMPFGIARDLLGSYQGFLIALSLLPLALAIMTIMFVRPPQRKC
ncbi:MAG: MFS transporter [Chloroflexota bacterium]